jgi:uncharacterized membrane protein YuzA (DUF378 family)
MYEFKPTWGMRICNRIGVVGFVYGLVGVSAVLAVLFWILLGTSALYLIKHYLWSML